MALHLAARLHALVHGMFRPGDEAETRELYTKVARLFDRHGVRDETGRAALIQSLAEDVLAAFGLPSEHPQIYPVTALIRHIFDYEGLLVFPRVDWSDHHSITEFWQIRDQLNEQRNFLEDFEENQERLRLALVDCLDPIYTACPPLLDAHVNGGAKLVQRAA